MALVAVFVLLGSIARAAKEMAIAYRYGVGAEVDAYIFVFNLVNWPIGVWFSVLTVVLVPLAARIQKDAPGELPRFRSELFGITLLIGFFLALLVWWGLPMLLRASWTGLPPPTARLALDMTPTLALLAPIGFIVSLFSAWMLAAGRHANTLLESVPALVILIALFSVQSGGVEPLVWGTLAGFAFHLVGLALPLARKGEIEAPHFTRQSSQWAPFWQGFGIMLVGQALMSFTGIIDQFFAAHLGAGAIATLSYANRILALILGLGAMAVSRATLPVFSQALAQGGKHIHRVAFQWIQLLFALGLVAMIVSWWLAPWGVKLLFERGAFTSENSTTVAEVLRYGLLKLPAFFALLVISSLLAATKSYYLWVFYIILFVSLRTALSFMLLPAMGLNGLMVSDAIAYSVVFVVYLVLMRAQGKQ
jgi:putative peptidoglycan lipid II flippase